MMKKGEKSRKKLHINLNLTLKQKAIIAGVTVAVFLCAGLIMYNVLSHYGGIGAMKDLSQNRYDMSSMNESLGYKMYDDENYESSAGIDVSVFQDSIDWEKVKASGIEFVMIRVGDSSYVDGEIHEDEMFDDHIRGAKDAGLKVGVYFFSQAITPEEAIAEARFVINHIRGKGVNYPVVFDMETIQEPQRIDDLTVEERTVIADAFCRVIDRNFYTPMIYGNYHWLTRNIDLRYLTDYDVWLAHYTDETDYPYEYRMWQYTDTGKVAGVAGNVDINVLFEER